MAQLSIFDGNVDFKIDKPIRLIELFAGYGSQALALKYLGVDFEHWKICEWAVKSIQAYKDMHFHEDTTDYSATLSTDEVLNCLYERGISQDYNAPMTFQQIKRLGEKKARQIYNNLQATHNLVSVCNCKGADLQIEDTDKYCYILTYSFPCFTADSIVLTDDGYKRIVDVKIGDKVLSHDNEYHEVVNCYNNGLHPCYSIKGMCIDEIKATEHHKFFVREKYKYGHKSVRLFKTPVWKELKDLTKNDYLGIAINQNSKLPEWNGAMFEWSDGRKSRVKNELSAIFEKNEFWWVIGRYIGDGWLRKQGGIIICCDKGETEEITEKLSKLPFKYSISEERTVNKIHIAKKELSEFCKKFGIGAENKHLTKEILDLPIPLLKSFLDGYLSADGCETNGCVKASSVSRELIYGISQCVAKVYKTPYRIYKIKVKKEKTIENRVVHQKDQYQLVFKTEEKKQDKAFYEDGYIWYPIREIKEIGDQNVYDIEVQNSHSFTIQNTIVHNCQDLSKAGKNKGMEKGSGTRSGLLWEVERILDECKEKPQVLLMENVPDVVGSKNVADFAQWRKRLEGWGYKCYWKILNAKDYGVPQNRARCFMVSILGDHYYDFPSPVPLKSRLKDVLEKNVDEKYYLSSNTVEMFVAHTEKQKEKGNGFKFEPTSGGGVAHSVLTRNGERPCDNFIKSEV